MLKKDEKNFLIIFIAVIIVNLFMNNLTLSLISSCIFLFLSLKRFLNCKKNNLNYDKNYSIVYLIILIICIIWLIINLFMMAMVSVGVKIIKELIKWAMTLI